MIHCKQIESLHAILHFIIMEYASCLMRSEIYMRELRVEGKNVIHFFNGFNVPEPAAIHTNADLMKHTKKIGERVTTAKHREN